MSSYVYFVESLLYICIETIKKNEYRLCFYKDRNKNKRLASSQDFILNLKIIFYPATKERK